MGGTPIKTYGYDAAGRTISVTSSAGTTNLTYDFESRVTQISGPGINASYSYNGLDTRVGKTENSVSNTFRRSGAYVTDPVLSDGTASYTPGVSRRTGTETRYFHTGLKNTDSLTNPGKTVAASRIYDAFGNVVSSSGTWRGPFGYAGNFGYQQDASGLKLLGHRYYDPSTGRFLTRDPIKDGRNWYAYGGGGATPTSGADPSGLFPIVVIYGLFLVVSFCIAMYKLNKRVAPAGSGRRESVGQAFENVGLQPESVYDMPTSDSGDGSVSGHGGSTPVTPSLGDPLGTGENIHDELEEVGNATIDGMHFQYDLINGVYDLPISVWDAIVDVFGTSAKDEVKKELQDIIVEGIVQPRVMSKP